MWGIYSEDINVCIEFIHLPETIVWGVLNISNVEEVNVMNSFFDINPKVRYVEIGKTSFQKFAPCRMSFVINMENVADLTSASGDIHRAILHDNIEWS